MEKIDLYNISDGDLGSTVANGLKKNFEDIVDDVNNKLSKDNTQEYTPTADYNPATKKYVDDGLNGKLDSNTYNADKPTFALKTEVNDKISGTGITSIQVVSVLPDPQEEGILYIVTGEEA